MRGLIIRTPFIDEILAGRKTWEIRGSNTNIRGRIALIRSGSGQVIGFCDLIDSTGPLSISEMIANTNKHGIPAKTLKGGLPYKKTFAWALKNPKRLKKPIPYKHPSGAITWVNLRFISGDEE